MFLGTVATPQFESSELKPNIPLFCSKVTDFHSNSSLGLGVRAPGGEARAGARGGGLGAETREAHGLHRLPREVTALKNRTNDCDPQTEGAFEPCEKISLVLQVLSITGLATSSENLLLCTNY